MAEVRDYGFIISPALTRLSFTPGQKVEGEFTYTNAFYKDSPEAQTFDIVSRFVFQKDGEPTVYERVPNDLASYDMSSWISTTEKSVTLKKGESTKIHYTIEVPKTVAPGGKYGTIMLAKKLAQNESPVLGAKLSGQIGFVILGKISGQEDRNSTVISFTSDHHVYFTWPFQPIIFKVTVKNNGNVDYLPAGNIFVHSGTITKPIKTFNINPDSIVVLPTNQRSIDILWEDQTQFIDLKNDRGIIINHEYFRIGRYIATAKIGYDLDGKRLTADKEIAIWLLPIPLLLAVGILLLTGILLVARLLSRKPKTSKQS